MRHESVGGSGGDAGDRTPYADATLLLDDRDDLIELVAQAVLDALEEREVAAGMVDSVVQRVLTLQREEAALRAAT